MENNILNNLVNRDLWIHILSSENKMGSGSLEEVKKIKKRRIRKKNARKERKRARKMRKK